MWCSPMVGSLLTGKRSVPDDDGPRGAALADEARRLYEDKDYVQVHGFTEIRTLLQMADIYLRLATDFS